MLLLATGIIRIPFFDDEHLPLTIKLGLIYTIAFLVTACGQFFLPARLALTGDLVPEPARGRAIGLDYVTENLAAIVGPPLAALLFLVGVQWALIINALTFVASLVAVGLIKPPVAAHSVAPGSSGNVWEELLEGARFLKGNRTLRTITITISLAMLGLGAVNALNVFFVQQNLNATAAIYASVSTAVGIGAIAGALCAALVVRRLGEGRAFWLSTVGIGTVILCLSRTTLIPPALVLAVLSGMLQAVVNVAIGPLLLNATPRVLVGRVSSLLNPTITLAALTSVSVSGWLTSTILRTLNVTWLGIHFGPIDTIFTVGGSLALLAGIYARNSLRSNEQPIDHSKKYHSGAL
jgi:MFS family permease